LLPWPDQRGVLHVSGKRARAAEITGGDLSDLRKCAQRENIFARSGGNCRQHADREKVFGGVRDQWNISICGLPRGRYVVRVEFMGFAAVTQKWC